MGAKDDELGELARLEAEAERRWDDAWESRGRGALHGNFSDTKSAFHRAIAHARRIGREADAERLDRASIRFAQRPIVIFERRLSAETARKDGAG